MKYCIDCQKKIDKRSIRCQQCHCKTVIDKITGANHPSKDKKPEDYYQWNGGKPRCLYCNVSLSSYNAKVCRQCFPKTISLDKHPNWQGGKSFEKYPLGWTKIFKEQIRLKYQYKCCKCGVHEVELGRRLSVHHINCDKSNLKVENLITLCPSCHLKTHWEIKKNASTLRSSQNMQ